MKTLSKIKLNQFSKDELDQRKMDTLKGGCGCASTCGSGGTCSAIISFGEVYTSPVIASTIIPLHY